MSRPKRPTARPIKFYKREFLNPKSGTAFVESSFTYSSESAWSSGSLKLADCNGNIILDFDCNLGEGKRVSKNANVQARLNKIDTLIHHLTGIREALVASADRNPADRAEWKQYHEALDAYNKAKGKKPVKSVIEMIDEEI
jgi:hypothetical protein